MNSSANCGECGRPIPADAPAGHCPHCLVEHGLNAARTEAEVPPRDAASAEPPRGRLIHYIGDYELIEEIGRGGMGVVYKARQVSLNRFVALKMILSGQLAGEVEVRRFLTEAEAAANLQHPNIVSIHEVGEHAGQHYFSMDLVHGKNLAELARRGSFGAAEAARITERIAEAIQYAHHRGILHRDLKPQNVMLDERGEPKITDFGLAKKIEGERGLTLTGRVMGSPSYMAPEQAGAKAEEIGPSTDVYAIGTILYELLTGRPPFVGDSALGIMMKVIGEDVLPLSAIKAAIPADLENICLKCLEKKRERRYPTARALAEDLARFRKDEPVLAKPASVWRKAASWFRRNPWLTMLGMTAGLILLVGAVFWLGTENRMLRWKATHPEFVPKAGPHTEGLRKVMGTFSISFLAGIGGAVFLAAAASLLKRSVRFRQRVSRVTETLIWRTKLLWIFSAVCLVHGVLVVKRGVEAHLWEGNSVVFPLGMAGIFVYFGVFMAFEIRTAAVLLKAQSAMGDGNVDFYAGFRELARGDWSGFWKQAIQGSSRLGASSGWEGLQAAWNLRPARLMIPLATAGLAIWSDRVVGPDYGLQSFAGWVFFMFIGWWINGCYWAVQRGQMSKARAVFNSVAMMATPLLVTLAIVDSFGSAAGAVLAQAFTGYALGLIGIWSTLRWRSA